MFTGRYPHSTGVLGLTHGDFLWRMNPNEKHLAQILSEAGYETALTGIMHEHHVADRLGYRHCDPGHWPVSQTVERSVKRLAALAASEKPFYHCIGFFEPHRPYDYGGIKPDSSLGVEIPKYIPSRTPEEKAAAEEDFSALQGGIRAADEGVGEILAALERTGKSGETIVLFTSDHGLAMPRAKSSLYDPGIEIPVLLRAPSPAVTGGKRYDGLFSNVDIVPTILDMIGLDRPSNLEGVSHWECLRTGGEPRSEIYAEKTFHTQYDPIRCVRTRTHKFIVNFEFNVQYDAPSDIRESPIYHTSIKSYTGGRERFELYDLKKDPVEQRNLFGQPEVAPIQASLQEKLVAWMRATRDPLLDGPILSPFYQEIRKTLRLPKLS